MTTPPIQGRRVFAPSIPKRHDPTSGGLVPSVDLRPAAEFGEIVVCTDAQYPISQSALDDDDLLGRLAERMVDIRPEDYVLAIGDPIMIAAAIAYANDANGTARVLRWRRDSRRYDVLEVVL